MDAQLPRAHRVSAQEGAATLRCRTRCPAVALVSCCILATLACGGDLTRQEHPANAVGTRWPAATIPLTDSFELVDSIVFGQAKNETAVLGIRALDVDRAGRLLITDSRSGNLKLVSENGTVLTVLGTKGDGPGEFRTPYDARFTPAGAIVVVDPTLSRVSYFSPSGSFMRSFSPGDQDPRLIVSPGDSIVTLAGLVGTGHRARLFATYTWTGTRLSTFGTVDSQVYAARLVVDNPWAASRSERSIGGLVLVPRIDEYDARGSLVAQATLLSAPPGWKQLRPPESDDALQVPADMRAWIQAASLVMGADLLEHGDLAVSVRTDRRDYLHLLSSDLRPQATFQVPFHGRLLRAANEVLYFVDEEGADVLLRKYRWKRHGH